jgi:hypothetical protein
MQFLEILWLGVVEVGHYQVRAQGFEKIRIQDPVQNITEHLERYMRPAHIIENTGRWCVNIGKYIPPLALGRYVDQYHFREKGGREKRGCERKSKNGKRKGETQVKRVK